MKKIKTGNNLKKTLKSKTSLVLIDQAMVSAANFLTGVLFARLLGLEAFGVYSLCWILVLLLNNIQISVVVSPLMSLLPKENESDAPFFLGGIFLQQFIFSVFALMVLLGFSIIAGSMLNIKLLSEIWIPFIIAASLFLVQDFIRRSLLALGKFRFAFMSDSVSYIGQLLLLFFLVFFVKGVTLNMLLWVIALTSFLGGLFGFELKKSYVIRKSVSFRFIKESFRFSKWLLVSGVLQVVAQNLPVILAASFLGAASAGGVKASQNLIGILKVLYQGLNNLLPKEASRILSLEGIDGLSRYLVRQSLLWSSILFVAILVIILFPEFWMIFVYGPEYALYANTLVWFCVIYIVAFFEIPVFAYLKSVGKTRLIFDSSLLMFVISVILTPLLCYWWGLNGVMLAMFLTTSSMILYAGAGAYHEHKRWKVNRS